MTTQTLPRSTRQLWLAAIKPPMYSVAVMPLWVGTAIAFAETGQVNWLNALTFLVAAILIVAWSNVSNDVYDAETGIDANKHHSVVNLTGNRSLMFWLGNGLLALGGLGMLAIAWWQQDGTVLGLVGLCCILGYLYQGPPFRLGYLGLGEILCFFAYGPLALSAVYYSQTQQWSVVTLAASVVMGITTSLILYCSHFHQVADDRAAGKRSPIVRLGTRRGAQLLPWLCGAPLVWVALMVAVGVLPLATLWIGASFPFALKLSRFVAAHHDQPEAVSTCKFIAVGFQFWSSLLLGAGFLLAG